MRIETHEPKGEVFPSPITTVQWWNPINAQGVECALSAGGEIVREARTAGAESGVTAVRMTGKKWFSIGRPGEQCRKRHWCLGPGSLKD